LDWEQRYDETKYRINDIEMAVEHEGIGKKVEVPVNEEIQYLIDD
jgi:hypothetical protein